MTAAPDSAAKAPFSGWRIVALAVITMVMTSPGQTIGVSVFIDPMIDGLGVTRDQVSLAYLIGTLSAATMLPIVGRRIDRFGLRTMMTIIALGFGVTLLGMSQVQGFATLIVGFLGIRLLGQGSLSLTATVAVGLWFEHNRGFAAGIVAAVGGGMMALTPIALNGLIGFTSWRTAWVLAAIIVVSVVLPMARFGMIDRPADVGQVPDGAAFVARRDRSGHARASRPPSTRAEALRNPAFWLLAAVVATPSLLTTALNFHQIAILGERGISEDQAAALFLPQFVGPLAAGLVFGPLADRLRPRTLMVTAMVMLAGAHGVLSVASNVPIAIGYGLTVSVAAGAVRTLYSTLFPRFFGTAELGGIMGVATTITVAASASGPFILSLAKTATGEFQLPVLLLGAVPLTIAAIVAVTPTSRVPELALTAG
ncbi:MAG: MFS transporter [Acidimicrobiales bacterium]|nr:MFS transporter [Acidimicrobiales bacterium]